MGVLETLVARLPGTVVAVDEDLHILAVSPEAEHALNLRSSEVLGRRCQEIMSAVDVDNGAPCYQHCPLNRASDRPGWAFNRMVESGWSGDADTRMDCFLFRSMLSTDEKGQFCFLGPFSNGKINAQFRGMQAIEAIHPLASNSADLGEIAETSLRAVLSATGAEATELVVLDLETSGQLIKESVRFKAGADRDTARPIISQEILELVTRSEMPVLTAGAAPVASAARSAGWFASVPLKANGRMVGVLAIASENESFDVAGAVRILFSMVAQLSLHLWGSIRTHDVTEGRQQRNSAKGTSRLRINCLGAFRLSVDGDAVPLDRFRRLKALTALKYLAAHNGGPVTREALMEVLWPGADPAQARGNLRVVLHALRRGLEPHLRQGQTASFAISRGDLVYLDPWAQVWIDSEQLSRMARRAARLHSEGQIDAALSECRQAASLYQGEYLTDDPYSDWCLFERARLRELYIDLLKRMGSILVTREDTAGAIDAFQTALGVDAGREEIHRQLMKALWQAGRRGEALSQFEACRKVLREEIDVEPTRVTKSLYQEILADL